MISGGPKGLSLCLMPWARPGSKDVPPCMVSKGTAAMWGQQGTTVGAPVSSTPWCELLKSTPVWEHCCLLCTRQLFLQPQAQQRGTESTSSRDYPCPLGASPAHPQHLQQPGPAAPPASLKFQAWHLPPAATHTTQVLPFIALGRNFIVSKDLLIL